MARTAVVSSSRSPKHMSMRRQLTGCAGQPVQEIADTGWRSGRRITTRRTPPPGSPCAAVARGREFCGGARPSSPSPSHIVLRCLMLQVRVKKSPARDRDGGGAEELAGRWQGVGRHGGAPAIPLLTMGRRCRTVVHLFWLPRLPLDKERRRRVSRRRPGNRCDSPNDAVAESSFSGYSLCGNSSGARHGWNFSVDGKRT